MLRPPLVIFSPDNWNSTQIVTVQASEDTVDNKYDKERFISSILDISRCNFQHRAKNSSVIIDVVDNDRAGFVLGDEGLLS